MKSQRDFDALVIGTSAGGYDALSILLPHFSAALPPAVLVVQHLHAHADESYLHGIEKGCPRRICFATDKQPIRPENIYFAPPNYHLLVERDWTCALSIDPKVNHARPSIDVLFECAASIFGPRLIGVIMTGASRDGSAGLRLIREMGGVTVVQDPADAAVPYMPKAAIDAADFVRPLAEIGPLVTKLSLAGNNHPGVKNKTPNQVDTY